MASSSPYVVTKHQKKCQETQRAKWVHNLFKGYTARMKSQLEQMLEATSTTEESKQILRDMIEWNDHLCESLKVTVWDEGRDDQK